MPFLFSCVVNMYFKGHTDNIMVFIERHGLFEVLGHSVWVVFFTQLTDSVLAQSVSQLRVFWMEMCALCVFIKIDGWNRHQNNFSGSVHFLVSKGSLESSGSSSASSSKIGKFYAFSVRWKWNKVLFFK